MKKILAVLVFLFMIGTVSPITAYSQTSESNDDVAIPWNGTSQLEVGKLYVLQACLSLDDPEAPCYIELFKGVEQQATKGTTQTFVMQCGINIKNSFGILVGKLWQDVSATWTYYVPYNYWDLSSINWTTTGTWASTPGYSWTNVVGPTTTWNSPNYGDATVKTTGDMRYLGLPWRSYQIRTRLFDNASNLPDFDCKSP